MMVVCDSGDGDDDYCGRVGGDDDDAVGVAVAVVLMVILMETLICSSANPSFTWSQCSKDQFATSFQHGLDICLYNVPQTIEPNNAFCGNGIVENGEQCDCGNSTDQVLSCTCIQIACLCIHWACTQCDPV